MMMKNLYHNAIYLFLLRLLRSRISYFIKLKSNYFRLFCKLNFQSIKIDGNVLFGGILNFFCLDNECGVVYSKFDTGILVILLPGGCHSCGRVPLPRHKKVEGKGTLDQQVNFLS